MKSDAGKLVVLATGLELKKNEETLGLPISDIAYAKCVVNDFRRGAPGRIIVRASKAHDWSKFAATIVPEPVEVASTVAARRGRKFFKPTGNALHSYRGPGPWCYFLPDDRTVVFGTEEEMARSST